MGRRGGWTTGSGELLRPGSRGRLGRPDHRRSSPVPSLPRRPSRRCRPRGLQQSFCLQRRRRRAQTLVIAERSVHLLSREHSAPSLMQTRQMLAKANARESRMARAASPACPRSACSCRRWARSPMPAACTSSWPRGVPARQLRHPIGLQRSSSGRGPRLDDRGDRVLPGRVLVPENAESKESSRPPSAGPGPRHEVLERGDDAVARPASRSAAQSKGQTGSGNAGFPWHQRLVAGQRLAVLLGDRWGAGKSRGGVRRPRRGTTAAEAGAGRPPLIGAVLAQCVVVVVAVDDHRAR